jgi:hypothetical protein
MRLVRGVEEDEEFTHQLLFGSLENYKARNNTSSMDIWFHFCYLYFVLIDMVSNLYVIISMTLEFICHLSSGHSALPVNGEESFAEWKLFMRSSCHRKEEAEVSGLIKRNKMECYFIIHPSMKNEKHNRNQKVFR